MVAAGQSANPLNTNSPLVLAAGATLKDAAGSNVPLIIPAGQSLKDNKSIIVGVTTVNVAATSGGGQTPAVNSLFAAPLVVTVTNSAGNPISGAVVTFKAPSSGPSAWPGGSRRPHRS